jgi:Probable Zinc-ribbon domain
MTEKMIRGKKTLNGGRLPLSQTHPSLALEAFGRDPNLTTYGSQEMRSWKCNKGHIWDAVVANRAIRGSGCPFCLGRKIMKGENDLQTLFPELAKEASGWDPSEISPGTKRKLPWMCKEGHLTEVAVYSRVKGIGCPVCSNQVVVSGINFLLTLNPDLASQADGWDPSKYSFGSHIKKVLDLFEWA